MIRIFLVLLISLAYTIVLALVLFIPANALAQPTPMPKYLYIPYDCWGLDCKDIPFYVVNTTTNETYEPLPYRNGNPVCHDPLYAAGVLGSTCHDEADETTSENATDWVDPMPKVLEEPEPCTPDGPECPPCPEGVEAGWCQDEDERQDVDDESEGGSDNGNGNGGDDNPEGRDDGEIETDIPSLFGEDENENENSDDPEPVID